MRLWWRPGPLRLQQPQMSSPTSTSTIENEDKLMALKTMRDALNDALHLEMARDPRVIVLGEDVSGGAGGTSGQRDAAGGIFGVTKGLIHAFGADRVIDTPISESCIIGAANGAALTGLRPI